MHCFGPDLFRFVLLGISVDLGLLWFSHANVQGMLVATRTAAGPDGSSMHRDGGSTHSDSQCSAMGLTVLGPAWSLFYLLIWFSHALRWRSVDSFCSLATMQGHPNPRNRPRSDDNRAHSDGGSFTQRPTMWCDGSLSRCFLF